MMWVCRAGKGSFYFNDFIEQKKLYLPWEGFDYDLNEYCSIGDYRKLVEKEKRTTNKTSISNWSSQLNIFAHEMKLGDYVIIPQSGKKKYALVKINGDYSYNNKNGELHHFRKIEILKYDIPKEVFPQSINYSLGAFRTVFKVKQEMEILEILNHL